MMALSGIFVLNLILNFSLAHQVSASEYPANDKIEKFTKSSEEVSSLNSPVE